MGRPKPDAVKRPPRFRPAPIDQKTAFLLELGHPVMAVRGARGKGNRPAWLADAPWYQG